MEKRSAQEDLEGIPAPKRAAIHPSQGQLSEKELEQFQKEAILRQLYVYKRERDALETELEACKKGDQELSKLRETYLELARKFQRPDLPKGAKELKVEEPEQTEQVVTADNEVLNREIAGLKGEISAQKKQLKEGSDRVIELEAKIRALELQLEAPSEEIIERSEAVKLLQKRISNLQSDNTHLENQLNAQYQQLQNIQRASQDAERAVRQEALEATKEMERKLDQAEADVARLRAARDDKIGELNIVKAAETEKAKSLEILKEMASISEIRNKNVDVEVPSADEISTLTGDALKDKALKLARQNAVLAAEIPSLEQAYSKVHAKAMAKYQEQAAIEAKINALSVSKAKADEKYFGAMRAKDALAFECAKLKASLAKTAEVVNTLRDTEDKLRSNIGKLERRITESEQKYSQACRNNASLEHRCSELESRLAGRNQELSAVQDQLRQRDNDLTNEQNRRRGLEANCEKQKRQLEIRKGTAGMSQSALEEELEERRNMLLCSLCTNNWKNCALKVCGHVFCTECTNKRLSSRMRKCPLCNSQFGHNDVLPIHL